MKCEPEFYGHPDCKACDCKSGSVDNLCDSNGVCRCGENFSGNKCDSCQVGYFNYPSCTSMFFSRFCNLTEFLIFCSECECNEDGSVDERCDDEGKCSCKSNVIGDKCSECQPDHYDYPRCEGKEKYPGFGQIIFKFFFSL